MRLVPEFEGQFEAAIPDDFVERIRRRVESGLMQPGNRVRANYRVRRSDPDSISFGAEGFATSYAIGLNEVTVRRVGRDRVHYHVTFWRWTRFAVGHGLLMGLVFLALYTFLPTLRRDVGSYANGAVWFWSMVGFWCLLWPWLLAAWHRGYAERALRGVLGDTLSSPEVERR